MNDTLGTPSFHQPLVQTTNHIVHVTPLSVPPLGGTVGGPLNTWMNCLATGIPCWRVSLLDQLEIDPDAYETV